MTAVRRFASEAQELKKKDARPRLQQIDICAQFSEYQQQQQVETDDGLALDEL